jgi:N-acetyl-anhydromuramyl-L-alanine amidase AmpD
MILKLGSSGSAVSDWQKTLDQLGYRVMIDEKFGPGTEKATIQFQHDHGIAPDGEVGPATLNAANRPANVPPAPVEMFDPSLRFIQASGHTQVAAPRVVSLLVVHVMEAKQSSTTAEAVGVWFAKPQSPISPPPPGFAPKASAHVGFDRDSGVQYVRPSDIAWGAPGGNFQGYHIEHAGYSAETDADWASADNDAMLRLSAQHAAKAVRHFGLSVTRLSLDEVAACTRDALIRKGELQGVLSGSVGGLCGHKDLTDAWQAWAHYGLPNPKAGPNPWWPSHTDPGGHFPWSHYLELLTEEADTEPPGPPEVA